MPETNSTDIITRAKAHLTPALVFHTDIVAVEAEGLYVWGGDGRRYMDFSSGLATVNLGHCPPTVTAAAKDQMERLIHSGCIFYYQSEVELAERLARVTPASIEMFFFSNSGAEAVEGALKLARFVTGRQGIIAFTGGFHGRTLGAVSLTTSNVKYRNRYHPLLPSVYHAPYPYCYRCPMGKERATCHTDCFEQLKRILRHQINPQEVACMVFEPILGEGGYVVPPDDYVMKLRELCTKEGILLVADEVQTGFGRAGKWFACEHWGLQPDIITMAKGIASGFPLSAVGASREIMTRWTPGAHGTTFGGNPVACAAACATIDAIENGSLLERSAEVSAYAMTRIRDLQRRCPSLGDVRGKGMMIGMEFINPDKTPAKTFLEKTQLKCLEAGLIIVECGIDKNIARLMPPLVTTKDQMQEALDIFEEALLV
ncbi:MAG: aspartate aminotransferase family protein [Deltaproteobacteria bacterium]|nr:aspartate aminotransferase family protein [Deltaproteobacteria bacterium]